MNLEGSIQIVFNKMIVRLVIIRWFPITPRQHTIRAELKLGIPNVKLPLHVFLNPKIFVSLFI